MSENFAKALLVEDEPNLAETIAIALKALGIPSVQASRIAEAKRLFEEARPDFILLDRALPDGDGLTLCRELREQGYTGSILVLTARGHVSDRVEGLTQGADDYLAKPFSFEELQARVVALARRQKAFVRVSSNEGQSSNTGLWSRDSERLRILGPKGWVDLTPLEFRLACHLIEANGVIVSREELLKSVWGFTLLPKTRTVDYFLSRLRKAFEENAEDPQHFLTIRGAGYRFKA